MAEKKTVNVEVTAADGVKPGYKTTEFWMSALAAICGLLFASGVIETGSTWEKVAGIVATALVSLGYTGSRGTLKKQQ